MTDYAACGALIDGMKAALGDSHDDASLAKLDWLESLRDHLRRYARRARTAGRLNNLLVKNSQGRFEIAPMARRPPRACGCSRLHIAHQHCAINGCVNMSVAEAIDPWPIEDLLWGCPEPRGWHCEAHRSVTKPCIGVLAQRCTALVQTHVTKQFVRCPACRAKADAVVAARGVMVPPTVAGSSP
ncbi:MAG: hypothetical protein F9K40_03160 [Kofleriaceae bacterium]|nr:MAG: hypothetical protein F9K40_03160 [Kofleriaceae bacterium]